VPLAEFTSIDALWIALSVFLALVGIALAYALIRLGGTLRSLSSLTQGLEREMLPLIAKAGGTVDRVNAQLDKVDLVTDSAVDAADSLDTAVRAVTIALTRPVKKISGLAAGLAHGMAAFRIRHDVRGAYASGRAAAGRREQEIEDELRTGGETA
jgi:HAMP domain-containing protein